MSTAWIRRLQRLPSSMPHAQARRHRTSCHSSSGLIRYHACCQLSIQLQARSGSGRPRAVPAGCTAAPGPSAGRCRLPRSVSATAPAAPSTPAFISNIVNTRSQLWPQTRAQRFKTCVLFPQLLRRCPGRHHSAGNHVRNCHRVLGSTHIHAQQTAGSTLVCTYTKTGPEPIQCDPNGY